ncbi:MAG: cation-translocating P-type ATPase [Anaerolineaceae bacterium]|nr:cation-translocating P-type ATPase [Anaerolineaceae bacterium]
MENKVELEIRPLLPGIASDEDTCCLRLENDLRESPLICKAHIKKETFPLTLCLHYDGDQATAQQIVQQARHAGQRITRRYHHDAIQVEGIDCSDCVTVIEHSVGRIEGVEHVQVDFADQRMQVEYDTQRTNRNVIQGRLRALGYSPELPAWQAWLHHNLPLLLSGLGGVLAFSGLLIENVVPGVGPWVVAVYVAAYLASGWEVSEHAWHAVRERRLDTDALMILAALGAAALGDWFEGAFLLFLFSLGHALEERALGRARAAVHSLAGLMPQMAMVRREHKEVEIPVQELRLGDLVLVAAGQRVPIDGQVSSGYSEVNQAPVTGESLPVYKAAGDAVYAGSINGDGAIEVEVTRLAKDSTLARVMKMVEDAQGQKSRTQHVLERFEQVYVPAVLIITVLLMAVPPLFGFPLKEAVQRALTLFVAASPCALALGTPAAVLSGVAQAARNGVLVKGGMHLENLSRFQILALDKTGTITMGVPELTDIQVLHPDWDEARLLSLAAAVERRSGHPLARAVTAAVAQRSLEPVEVDGVQAVPGRGMVARYGQHTVLLGAPALLSENQVSIPAAAEEVYRRYEGQGKMVFLVAVGDQLAGALVFADQIRPDVKTTLQRLRRAGARKIVLLTGDRAAVAAQLAEQAGVDEVYAELMPEDKLARVQELSQQGFVAMVGDGVNDAPALAAAGVGIAMGGAASAITLETSDVVLLGTDFQSLAYAAGLGRAVEGIIWQNLAVAIVTILVLSGMALTGVVGITLAVFFHEGSTLLVVANALRLLGWRPAAA